MTKREKEEGKEGCPLPELGCLATYVGYRACPSVRTRGGIHPTRVFPSGVRALLCVLSFIRKDGRIGADTSTPESSSEEETIVVRKRG
jgi:hypothetical protein